MKEVFRACGIDIKDEKGYGLCNFFLSVQQEEVLGILGNRYTGKRKLFSIIAGDAIPSRGSIFFDGKRYEYESYIAIAKESVLCLSKDNLLIDGLTVRENIAILWKTIRHMNEYNHRKLYKMIHLLLKEFDLSIDINSKVGALTPIQKLSLEIIVIRSQKTKLILVDSFEIEGPTEEFLKLRQLMIALKKEGISFVFFGHQLSVLPYLSDRIAFLNKGRNIKVIKKTSNFKEEAEKIEKEIYEESTLIKRKYLTEEKKILSLWNLDVHMGKSISIELFAGEFTTIVTPSLNVFEILQERILGNQQTESCTMYFQKEQVRKLEQKDGIIFLDMNYLDHLIEDLSPMYNLCLGLSEKVSFLGFEKQNRVKCIQEDFYEWYGNEGVFNLRDSKKLYQRDRIAINLYRLKLLRRKVIICTDFNRHIDILTKGMVRNILTELLGEGVAICMITGDLNYSDEMVDHYILLSNETK